MSKHDRKAAALNATVNKGRSKRAYPFAADAALREEEEEAEARIAAAIREMEECPPVEPLATIFDELVDGFGNVRCDLFGELSVIEGAITRLSGHTPMEDVPSAICGPRDTVVVGLQNELYLLSFLVRRLGAVSDALLDLV